MAGWDQDTEQATVAALERALRSSLGEQRRETTFVLRCVTETFRLAFRSCAQLAHTREWEAWSALADMQAQQPEQKLVCSESKGRPSPALLPFHVSARVDSAGVDPVVESAVESAVDSAVESAVEPTVKTVMLRLDVHSPPSPEFANSLETMRCAYGPEIFLKVSSCTGRRTYCFEPRRALLLAWLCASLFQLERWLRPRSHELAPRLVSLQHTLTEAFELNSLTPVKCLLVEAHKHYVAHVQQRRISAHTMSLSLAACTQWLHWLFDAIKAARREGWKFQRCVKDYRGIATYYWRTRDDVREAKSQSPKFSYLVYAKTNQLLNDYFRFPVVGLTWKWLNHNLAAQSLALSSKTM